MSFPGVPAKFRSKRSFSMFFDEISIHFCKDRRVTSPDGVVGRSNLMHQVNWKVPEILRTYIRYRRRLAAEIDGF